jgi:hypothetical protein
MLSVFGKRVRENTFYGKRGLSVKEKHKISPQDYFNTVASPE